MQTRTPRFWRHLGATALFLAGLTATGCNHAPENPPPVCDDGAAVCTEADGETRRTGFDSTDGEVWHHLDFESGAAVDAASDVWDLAVQRYRIKVNGGISGSGGVEVAILKDTTFDAVTAAPKEGWITDADGEAELGRGDPLYAFFQDDGWYSYDFVVHKLAPREGRVYVVKTVEQNFVKVELQSYYNADGVAGHVVMRWDFIDPPPLF